MEKNNKMNKLVKISTYAKNVGLSVPAIYKRIASGTVECVEIDGVKFIKCEGDEEDKD